MSVNEYNSSNDYEEKNKDGFQEYQIGGMKAFKLKGKTIDDLEEKVSQNSIVFSPGFGRTLKSTTPLIEEFSNCGRNTCTLDHPRFMGEVYENPVDIDIPISLLRRATSICKLITSEYNDTGEKVDLVGQSLGAIDTVMAALILEEKSPGMVGSLVLVNPAGSIDEDNFASVKERFREDQKNENESNVEKGIMNAKIAAKEGFLYVIKNPFRALKEAEGAGNIKLKTLLNSLKDKTELRISMVQGVDDLTYPMGTIQEQEKNVVEGELYLPDLVDGFYSVLGKGNDGGSHNNIYLDPKTFAPAINAALLAHQNLIEE